MNIWKNLYYPLPFQVGHIKRLQHGIKDIQQGRLPPRLLQCVTISFPATSTPSLTTATTTSASATVTTSTSGAAAVVTSVASRASASPSKCAFS